MFTFTNNDNRAWICICLPILWICLMKAILGLCTCPLTLRFSLIKVIKLLKILIVVVFRFFHVKNKVKLRKRETKIHKLLQKLNPLRNSQILQCNLPPALIRAIKTVEYHSYNIKHHWRCILASVIVVILPPSGTITRKLLEVSDSWVKSGKKLIFTVSHNLLWDSCHYGLTNQIWIGRSFKSTCHFKSKCLTLRCSWQ